MVDVLEDRPASRSTASAIWARLPHFALSVFKEGRQRIPRHEGVSASCIIALNCVDRAFGDSELRVHDVLD